jgi:transposase
MFIRKTTKHTKRGKTYHNYLLVESIATPKGPRHRVVCSLGSLKPAPENEWLVLARKVEAALGGQEDLVEDPRVERIVEQVRSSKPKTAASDLVAVHTDRVGIEEPREAGPVHVGHQMWKRLGLDTILSEAGLSPRTRLLTEVMTLNRLIQPLSEHAMPDWTRRVAMGDILGASFSNLNDEALYRNMDKLHPCREVIETKLSHRERTLFDLDESIYLYDLTSVYFEGQCPLNPQAKRGYSRDKRPDCKQVVVGLVVDREGFPKAHEVFEGSRRDCKSVEDILTRLEQRTGKKGGATVVVDRGMGYDDTLQLIKDRGYHYIVASRQSERDPHLDELEDNDGWEEIIRQPSPRNPAQKKPRVWVKQGVSGEGVHILCRSEGRKEKDRAIREKHEARLLSDLTKLQLRVSEGRLKNEGKIFQALGRLRERHSRVARFYSMAYDPETKTLSWQENAEKKPKAEKLDGSYLLKTDRKDMTQDEIWRTYMLLTRIENAFRNMKSPLMERPIFHHLEHRVHVHIFLCVLAYHLLVAIEKMFLDAGIHTSWWTLRQELATHQVATVVLLAADGRTLRIRKGTTPEEAHKQIYQTLQIPEKVMKPVKTWGAFDSD